ncbi:MAG TPA: polysaccharide deacetylase family protein, partial [Limnochordia bacterium]|nr:polysaccharide deacetylase family protein [Limnochordia bacterium]
MSAPNLAERLGRPPGAKLLIVHADDAGMCHSANAATMRALTEGIVSSTSVMVPCPWFPELAAWVREHPEADVGVHLTLTSEWRYYRWRPTAPLTSVPGLLDGEGFMWREPEEVSAHASPTEVEIELRAQIEQALAFGIRPTHLDSHMGTLYYDPRYLQVFVAVSRAYGMTPMLVEPPPDLIAHGRRLGFDYAGYMSGLRNEGFPLLDRLI